MCQGLLADVAYEQGDVIEARWYAEAAVARSAAAGGLIAVGAHRAMGKVEFALGNDNAARTHVEASLVAAQRVLFLSDGTAATSMGGLTAEELHKATLATLGAVFGQVLTAEEVIQKMCHAQVPSASAA
jgi:hypothetical protein